MGRLDRILTSPKSGHAGNLEEASAGLEVGVLVRLGLGRKGSRRGPQVDQGLHRLELHRLQQVESGGRQHKVAKAAVELLLEVQVVKGLGEVGPVKVGVDAKHLQKYSLADGEELLGEPAPFPNPLVGAVEKPGGSDLGVVCERDLGGLSGKHLGVVNLARDPALHECNVLERGELDGLKLAVQPCVGVVSISVC